MLDIIMSNMSNISALILPVKVGAYCSFFLNALLEKNFIYAPDYTLRVLMNSNSFPVENNNFPYFPHKF